MPEITITAPGENWKTERDRLVDFCIWHINAGISVHIKSDSEDKNRDKFASISKEDAIALAQMILQMYQLPFTPNPTTNA